MKPGFLRRILPREKSFFEMFNQQAENVEAGAIAMVEGYVAGLDPADEPVGVERTVATRTEVIAVSGRIDRLDSRPRADLGESMVVASTTSARWDVMDRTSPGMAAQSISMRSGSIGAMVSTRRAMRSAPLAPCTRPRSRWS